MFKVEEENEKAFGLSKGCQNCHTNNVNTDVTVFTCPMPYEVYQICDCTTCEKENCLHRDSFRRLPQIDGGLGLCPMLIAMREVKEIILAKCKEREDAGYETLADSDIMDILDECERQNISITKRELEIIGLD